MATASSSPILADHLQQVLVPGVTTGMQKSDSLFKKTQVHLDSQGASLARTLYPSPKHVKAASVVDVQKKVAMTKDSSENSKTDESSRNRSLQSGSELKNVKCEHILVGHKGPVTFCKIINTPYNTYVLTSSLDTTIKVWNFHSGQFLMELDCGKPVYCFIVVQVTEDKLLVLPGCDDGRVPTWKVKPMPCGKLKARCTNLISCHSPNPIRSMAVSPCGTGLATGCCFFMQQINKNGTRQRSIRGNLKTWNLSEIVECATSPKKHVYDVRHKCLKTMLQLVAPFYQTEGIHYNAAKLDNVTRHLGIKAVAYSQDSTKLVVGFGEPTDHNARPGCNMMVLCCALTLTSLWVHHGTIFPINGLSFLGGSCDQRGGASNASWDVWPLLVSSSRSLHLLLVHTDAGSSSSQSMSLPHTKAWEYHFQQPHQGVWPRNDGHVVATATGSTLQLWHTATGNRVGSCQGHTDTVIMADFSPEDSMVCTASLDGTARLWRLSWQPESEANMVDLMTRLSHNVMKDNYQLPSAADKTDSMDYVKLPSLFDHNNASAYSATTRHH